MTQHRFSRRSTLLKSAAGVTIASLSLLMSNSWAQTNTSANTAVSNWPNKPIKLIVPFASGGANDLLARAAAEGATKVLGQPVVIDNKPGAGGTLGTMLGIKSAPDGYTFLISAAGVISNTMIKKSAPYKDNELVPVVMIGLAPSIIVTSSKSKHTNLKEFIENAKQGQGAHFATAGTGSTPHFVAEMMNMKYGTKLIPVPYKSGSESSTAVMGGQVEGTSEASIVSLPHIQPGGKFRALATTWTKRMSAAPDLPTTAELGYPDVQIAHWAGIHAPVGVPPEIMDKMAAAVDAAMKNPEIANRLKSMGIEPVGGTRASFNEFVNAERSKLGAIIRASGMKED
jgi:tripartite-type tricarboxylate transporter receptor subunit TctC